MPKLLPTPEMLRKLLRYDPERGLLFWKGRPEHMFHSSSRHPNRACASWNAKWAGKEAFTSKSSDGYLRGAIFYRSHRSHRVIWAIVHGEWPEADIDHINGVRNDNRIANLRSVSRAENCKNQKLRIGNPSGYIGVSWYKPGGTWRSRITINGKQENLGHFTKKDDAIAARKAADIKYGYHENHGRK